MGRSRKIFFLALASAVPALVACNAIVGIDDFRKTECGPNPCPPPDGGPDQIVDFDRFVPDSGPDSTPDAPPGVDPVSWAQFPMPNYKPGSDAGTTVRPIDSGIVDNDIVTDNVTGLVWRRAVIGQGFGTDFKLSDARAACLALTNGPWRLPKRIELVTLLSYGSGAPFVDTSIFTGVPNSKVWTSSEVRPLNGKYWGIDFETGALVQLDQNTSPAKALCVKAKQ